jgi:hypothetical protein
VPLETEIKKVEILPLVKCKLCSDDNLRTIAASGGRFITVIPRHFREVKDLLHRVQDGMEIEWQHQYQVPGSRKKGRINTDRIHVGERRGEARILWIHGDTKDSLERQAIGAIPMCVKSTCFPGSWHRSGSCIPRARARWRDIPC